VAPGYANLCERVLPPIATRHEAVRRLSEIALFMAAIGLLTRPLGRYLARVYGGQYAGETTMSNLSQMAGIKVHSFLSGASGIAVAVTLIRGFARQRSPTIGNFWVDLTRGTLYVLIPTCVLAALFLVSQGVPQTLAP
jgi:K+-transporting ATPase A subunit